MVQCFSVRVFGRVQGVFFRDSARRRAVKLGLAGYAKNMPDGSVEIAVQGEEAIINEFIKWARGGPMFARVDRVETEELPLGDFTDFEIRY